MKATVINVFDNEGNEIKNVSTEIVLNGETYVKKEADKQPGYSHLVGMWVKFISDNERYGQKKGKWYQVDHIGSRSFPIVIAGDGSLDSRSWSVDAFSISNPQETNPDEVKKILVPKEIVISEDVDGLNLHFGNNQALYVYKGADGYGVLNEADREPIQCELIKCERAELKKGDVAFRTGQDSVEHFLMDICSYCIIINETDYCFSPNNEDVITDKTNWKHWYKLQPIV